MNTLFGAPMGDIMRAMLVVFMLITAVVATLALRNPLLVKLGLRNIPRRRAQTIRTTVGDMNCFVHDIPAMHPACIARRHNLDMLCEQGLGILFRSHTSKPRWQLLMPAKIVTTHQLPKSRCETK